jgi:hypothetical protein
MAEEEKTKEPMEMRLAKIKRTFEGITLPKDADREARSREIVSLCMVSKSINKELQTHPGVYACLAEEKVALKEEISKRQKQLRVLNDRIEGLTDFVISLMRQSKDTKITEKVRDEVISLIKLGLFPDSPIYQDLDFEEEAAFGPLNEKYAEVQNLLVEVNKLEDSLIDFTTRHALLDEIVDCLGYQKLACLKALVEREASGLAQQTT